jgi:hypothetical protein
VPFATNQLLVDLRLSIEGLDDLPLKHSYSLMSVNM